MKNSHFRTPRTAREALEERFWGPMEHFRQERLAERLDRFVRLIAVAAILSCLPLINHIWKFV